MEHLDDDTVGALTEGLLAEPELQALHAHADGCEACRALLAEVGRGMGLVGGKLGRFVVLDQAGAGGMGIVYAAYDPELDRKVALKLVKPERTGPDGTSRLLREARAAAQLAHPNVVTVYEVGSLGDELFVAMEYVEGGTLSRWLAEKPRTPREVLAVLVQAGRGLAAAHAAGLVHRDFKPDNVLVGADGRARVSDFGLARAFSEPATAAPTSGSPTLMLSAHAGGTPAFMAPEQRQGHASDARSDQFSFCLAACEALYGERPAGPTAAPPTRATLKVRRGVPERVRRALARGLSADPQARFPSMEALLKELRPPRRLAPQWAAAGALLGVGLAVAGFRLAGSREREQCRVRAADAVAEVWNEAHRAAVERAFAAHGSKAAGRAVTWVIPRVLNYTLELKGAYLAACEGLVPGNADSRELYEARLGCLDGSLDTARALVELFERADARVVERSVAAAESLPLISLCAQPKSGPALGAKDARGQQKLAELRKALAAAWVHRHAGRPSEAVDKAKAAREVARALGHVPSEAKALLLQGYTEDFVGQTQASHRTFLEAFTLAQASGDDLRVAEAALALMYSEGTQLQDAARGHFWDAFVKATLRRLGDNPTLEASRLDHLGGLMVQEERYAEALPLLQEGLALNLSLYGPDNPKSQGSLGNVAAALLRLERYEEAEASFKQMIASRERAVGEDHPSLILGLQNLAMVHLLRHNNEEALAVALRGVELSEKTLGLKSRRTLVGWIGLGRVQSALGRHAEAVATLRRTVEATGEAPPTDPFPGVALLALAEVELGAKDYASAARAAEQALEKLERISPDSGEVVSALAILGEAQRASHGKLDEARQTLTRALKLAQGKGGDRMNRADIRFSLAQLLWERRAERTAALQLAEEALALREQRPEEAAEAQKIRAWLGSRRDDTVAPPR